MLHRLPKLTLLPEAVEVLQEVKEEAGLEGTNTTLTKATSQIIKEGRIRTTQEFHARYVASVTP